MKTFVGLICFLWMVAGSALAYDGYGDNTYGPSVPELTPQEQAFMDQQTEVYRGFLKLVREGNLREAEKVLGQVKIWRYEQGGLCYLAGALTNRGDLNDAERIIAKIKDSESKQYALYKLATDGYASRGKVAEAVKTARDLAALFGEHGENRAVPSGSKISVDVVAAVTENRGERDSDRVIDSVMDALSHVSGGIYYELMAVEQVVLRLPAKGAVDKFLARAGYTAGLPSVQDGMTVVVYCSAKVQLIVSYGTEDGALRAFAVSHKLDEKSQQEFMQSMHCDEDLQDWLMRESQDNDTGTPPGPSI